MDQTSPTVETAPLPAFPPISSAARVTGWIGLSGTGVLCMLLSTMSVISRGADVVWTNLAGGSWSSPANWSPNQVPVAGDKAFITNSGTYTVTLDVSPPVLAGLTVGGGTGTQTLSNRVATLSVTAAEVLSHGEFVWVDGALGGQMTIRAGGVLNIPGGADRNMNRLVLVNEGTVNWSGGTLRDANQSPRSRVTNAGLWQIQGGGI